MSPPQMMTVPVTSPPALDFSIRVERGSCEPLFAGIFSVTLGNAIPVTFVPGFEHPQGAWQDALLGELHEIQTVEAARMAAVLVTGYVVTPDDSRAGQTEIVRVEDGDAVYRTAIFYVTTEQFEIFAFELADEANSPQAPISAFVSRYGFAQFLLHDVVESLSFLAEDRSRLRFP